MSDMSSKIINLTTNLVSALPSTVSKKQDEIAQVAQNVLEKSLHSEKAFSQAMLAQGKAGISLQGITQIVADKAKAQKQTEALNTLRKAVKKTPLPFEKQENLLSEINAKIEDRYLASTLSMKSAKDSAGDILRLSPVDLSTRKEKLFEKYGDKLKDSKLAKSAAQAAKDTEALKVAEALKAAKAAEAAKAAKAAKALEAAKAAATAAKKAELDEFASRFYHTDRMEAVKHLDKDIEKLVNGSHFTYDQAVEIMDTQFKDPLRPLSHIMGDYSDMLFNKLL